ncbi:MAG: porin [Azospirillaceae bacterium]
MKKYLLAGTALAGAVAFGGQAFAQAEPVSLELSGVADFQAGVASEDNDGARDRDYDFLTDGEIVFEFSGVTDNGLSFGGELELDGVTTNDGVGVDELFAFIGGDAWGQVRLGDKEGPLGNFAIAAPVAGDGIWDGGFGSYVTGTTPNVDGFDNDLGDSTKIHYLTPNFSGFQAGIAFAPNDQEGATGSDDLTDASSTGGEELTVVEGGPIADLNGDGDTADSFPITSDETTTGRPEHENFFSIGGAYGGDFGATSVELAGGFGFADYVGANADDDDFMTTNLGLNVGFGGFTVGGSWVALLESGGSGIEDRNNFTLGASYTTGMWTVGVSGLYTQTDLETGGENEGYTIGAGVDYDIATGLNLYADLVYFEADQADDADDNDGVVGLAGVAASF